MATSGSWDYNLTAANLIVCALEDIQVIQSGESINSDDQTIALRALNLLAKQWQGTADQMPGIKVWTRQRVTLALAKGQQSYLIGPASTDARASTQMGRTTLDAAEASGQTTLSVAATSDTTSYPGTTLTMTAADIIGIELDDGTIQWSTVSSISAGDTVTIPATGLTGAAASGNAVYWFTSRAQRFPDIEAAVLRDENMVDIPLGIYTDVQQYESLTNKTADGDPTDILIEPLRLNTRVTCNIQPNDVTKRIVMTVIYPAEDYDATTDDIAFPQEFYAALEWELAFRLSPKFGKPWTQEMQMNYDKHVGMAIGLNPQNTSMHFEPGRD